jgi:hypothetical protein
MQWVTLRSIGSPVARTEKNLTKRVSDGTGGGNAFLGENPCNGTFGD